jgi:ABC-2 type transport system permease protein
VDARSADGPPVTPRSVLSAGSAGTIYDLGYQPYTGPRQGRGRALAALFRAGLRRVWGIGRPFRAKLMPWGLLGIAVIPALIQLGIAALVSERISVFRYEDYYGAILLLILLFCTTAAPDLLCPDQRQHVLSLYFSRALARTDYVLARLGALVAALLILALGPEALLYVGHVFAADDSFAYVRDNLAIIPRILAAGGLLCGYFAALSLAIAAYTTRRVYAAGAFIALMLGSAIVLPLVHEALDNDLSRALSLLTLSQAPVVAGAWIFDVDPPSFARRVDLPLELWVLAVLAYTAAALAVLVHRYVRMAP